MTSVLLPQQPMVGGGMLRDTRLHVTGEKQPRKYTQKFPARVLTGRANQGVILPFFLVCQDERETIGASR